MSHHAHKSLEHTRMSLDDDILAWLVVGAIFGGVTLALWGMLIWQSLH